MERGFPAAEELAAALRAGEVTSAELTDDAIARIERDDELINAICVPDFDRARAAAHDADRARARGADRPLLGIPVTVKESYNIAGLPTTWGMPQHRDYLPAEDAVQVSRLKAAGAVILGKTNVPLGLQDLQSFNEIYGTTSNPWDHARTPGGSSGGSAAALAAGFGALSVGSDIGGSLRTPAHFCGVYAHKPTLGLAANRGMTPPASPAFPVDLDLAVVGPMARTARDLTLLLDVMAGPDPLTLGMAYKLALPPARHQRLSDFRVLVLDEHPLLPTGSAVRAGVNRVADALADGGARVERHSPLLPSLGEAATLYTQLLFSGSVARFPVEAYEELRTQAAGLSADDQSLGAARLRAMAFSHRDWIEADDRRELHRHRWRRFFAEFDAVVCPVTPTPAFPHDHNPDLLGRRIDIDGAEYPFFDQLVWAGLATTPGLPATAIPTGLSPGGLPVGVQLIGPMFEDRTPLRLAELLEQRIGGFQAPEQGVLPADGLVNGSGDTGRFRGKSGPARQGSGLPDDDRGMGDPRTRPDPALGLLELYDDALPHVYGYLLGRCGDPALAEDLTAESFLAAVHAVREPDAPGPTTAWLIGVARHKLADHWRRVERERRGLRLISDEAVTADDPWDTTLDRLRAREILEALGPHHRAALTLRYLDGLPVPEVARHLDRTTAATEALLARARNAFRRLYTAGEEDPR